MKRSRVNLKIVGERIKKRRKEYPGKREIRDPSVYRHRNGITQQEFADLLNVSLDTVKNWEQGYNYPSIEMLIKIADILNCDVDYLLGRQEFYCDIHRDIAKDTGITETAADILSFSHKQNKSYIKVLSSLIEDEYFLYQIADHENLSKESLNCALQNFINKLENKSNNKVEEKKNGKLHADK
jgi:transcriptional regulator with XRE-family HTH domain